MTNQIYQKAIACATHSISHVTSHHARCSDTRSEVLNLCGREWGELVHSEMEDAYTPTTCIHYNFNRSPEGYGESALLRRSLALRTEYPNSDHGAKQHARPECVAMTFCNIFGWSFNKGNHDIQINRSLCGGEYEEGVYRESITCVISFSKLLV